MILLSHKDVIFISVLACLSPSDNTRDGNPCIVITEPLPCIFPITCIICNRGIKCSHRSDHLSNLYTFEVLYYRLICRIIIY
jgi:hypothetical protein